MAARRQLTLPKPGSPAPGFRLPLLGGGEVSLADLTARGRVVLAFFKVTCPICQLTFPYLERIHQPGVLPVYGISQNDPEDTAEFNREFGVTFPTLLDSEDAGFPVSNEYGISSVPTTFIVEPDGTISRIVEGWRKQEIEWLGSQAGIVPIRPGEYVPEWKAG
jgi:peroxiredoxin